MTNETFDLIIIGSGPGGYVAAIRASQLGKKVAVVEREHIGGICLNWGCIPTKALMKSAEVYTTINQAKRYGFTLDNVSFDFSAIIKRSRQLATRMSKGVQFLFKKNNITIFSGNGKLVNKDTVTVVDQSGEVTNQLTAKHIIIATGASPRSIPGIEIDRKRVISSK